MHPPEKILVIRNDKIGDFMLAWPALSLLKKQYPDAEITALVPGYTAPLAEQCEWIDKILLDEKKPSFLTDISSLAKKIKNNRYDVSISLFSETRTSLALFLAGVSTRIGPATKFAQIFLNKKLRQKRSQSIKPEYEYNTDLIRYFISNNRDVVATPQDPPFLAFDRTEITALQKEFRDQYSIAENCKLVFIHPGTGGSAVNLSLEQYTELAHIINRNNDIYFVITAGPDELEYAENLSGLIEDTDHHLHHSASGIIDFSKLINICDVFISGSTGPLHIAGALDVCTAAFYPARQSATPLRWQTINVEQHRLSFSPDKYTGEQDMQTINIPDSARAIVDKFITVDDEVMD